MQFSEEDFKVMYKKVLNNKYTSCIEDSIYAEIENELDKHVKKWVKANKEFMAVEIAKVIEKEVWPTLLKKFIADYKRDGSIGF